MKKYTHNISLLLFSLFFLLFSLLAGPGQAASAPPTVQDIPDAQPGTFTPGECVIAVSPEISSQINCGMLTVPERHENPDGEQIQLAVMVISSTSPDRLPDPLFIAQGGPGASTIDTYAEIFLSGKTIVDNRDLVLFDQRGTLHSQPSLLCSEYDQLMLDTIELDLSDVEARRLDLDAAGRCRQRLEDEGIDLSAYNSLQNAADIQSLRLALGYDQINLYGVSYGTLLALHTLRFYPQGLRSVILDAVVPPQTNFLISAPQTGQRALDTIFQTCLADSECSRAFPDLEAEFYQIVDTLNQTPARAPVTDPDSGITYQMVLDGDTFLSGVFQFLYIGDIIPALPHIIFDARQGNFDLFTRVFSIIIFDRSMSYGMYYSVLCAEDADFDPSQVDLRGVSAQMAQAEKDGPAQFKKVCEVWQVEEISLPMDEAVRSDKPVLLLSGGFDPITPAENGQLAASSLQNSFAFEFPTGGHGAALSGACQDSIIQAFLDNPTSAPDGACITPAENLEFFTPATVIEIPAILQLLNLQNNRGIEFLLLFSAAAFLSLFIFLVPMNWLRARRQNEQQAKSITQEKTWSAAPWLLWLLGLTVALFLASLVAILVFMIVSNDNRLFYGLPGSARFLFVLPLVFAIFTVLLGFTWVGMLRQPGVGFWRKTGYSLVLASAILILAVLARWQLLWALF